MADVRALLRQQRASRRINHPFAAYSDAGKLLCSLCREEIKAESFWEQHIKGTRHLQRAQDSSREQTQSNGQSKVAPQLSKRKHDEDDETALVNADDDAARKKRSKTTMDAPLRNGGDSGSDKTPPKDSATEGERQAALTPPTLARRASVTPSQGIELQIPSRPATPRDGKLAVHTQSGSTGAIARQTQSPDTQTRSTEALPGTTAAVQPAEVDEDEWAAFEAEIAAAAAAPAYSEDAVISAPAMSAGEHAAAARSMEEERERRQLAAEQDLVDEKEEATRALETEFEEMEELEARVRKLKERREALRAHEATKGPGQVRDKKEGSVEVTAATEANQAEDDDVDDEDDSSEDDDFMSFR
ncbi:hypothetical protein B0T11DRAFT_290864 [Plectosphaerella cucumerina]|uniref:Coiled-coil domain-containing protein 16 n=1 Tax=Plectosphaerella cucumerina TaxID=40658 RepID=A0A8K0WYQ9_9PEZI|nr:hypothetical protein B0T11DRAFT_290864 [Plectosphaerella cucumerina]